MPLALARLFGEFCIERFRNSMSIDEGDSLAEKYLQIGEKYPSLIGSWIFRRYKTVRIETHSSEFGGTFFLQPDRPCFFSGPRREKQKTKIRHMEPGRSDGRQRLWLFLLPVGRPRPFQSMARVDRVVGDAAYDRENHKNELRGHKKMSCDGLNPR